MDRCGRRRGSGSTRIPADNAVGGESLCATVSMTSAQWNLRQSHTRLPFSPFPLFPFFFERMSTPSPTFTVFQARLLLVFAFRVRTHVQTSFPTQEKTSVGAKESDLARCFATMIAVFLLDRSIGWDAQKRVGNRAGGKRRKEKKKGVTVR